MLNKNDFNCLSVIILKKLCKNKIKCGKLKKKELISEYNRYLAIKQIQKRYREHFYKNAIDHITLEKVSYPCFIYRTKSKSASVNFKHYFYEYSSIIKYIMKSGDTRDPMTRAQYSDTDLIRLDTDSKKHFPLCSYKSTLKIKNNVNYARKIRNRENEILSFQLRLDELKEIIIFIISDDIVSWNLNNEPILIDNVEYRSIDSYINTVILELKIIFLNLKKYDTNSANQFKITILEEIEAQALNVLNDFILSMINSINNL